MELSMITSRQNALVKTVCALSEKKYRKETGLFRFDGVKLFLEAVSCRLSLSYVFLREDVAVRLLPTVLGALDAGLLPRERIVTVSEGVFEKMSEEKSPEGILTVAPMLSELHLTGDAQTVASLVGRGERILLAESLQDPGNLGTVMRSCAALGIDRLILGGTCADLYHARTVRAAMGALFRLPTVTVQGAAFADAIGALRDEGRKIYATALHREARVIGSFSLSAGDAFVIGNEGHGLSPETIEACDASALIPMCEGSESLNAAAAAAICIWETVRKGE